MATEPLSVPEPRTPLSRERVLRAAVRLADEGGFESVTMRRLGRELGVQAMSLYNHVANKDDIRNGIVEMVMAEIETPADGEDWKAAIRQSAISTHEVFLRHPWACSLQMATTTFNPEQMQHTEWILRTLREAGFSADMTHHAYHALEGHITGFTLWQVSLPFESKEELVDLAEDPSQRSPRTSIRTSSSTPSSTSLHPARQVRPSSSSGSISSSTVSRGFGTRPDTSRIGATGRSSRTEASRGADGA